MPFVSTPLQPLFPFHQQHTDRSADLSARPEAVAAQCAHLRDTPRPSNLRRVIFGPSKWPVLLGSVRAICGPPRRQMAKKRHLAGQIYYLVNLLTVGPFIARLLNAARAIFGPPGIFK